MLSIVIGIYPFIKDLPSIINFECQFLYYYEIYCKESRIQYNRTNAIINTCLGILSIILILIGILKSPKSQNSKTALERRLVIQTLVSSTSMALMYFLSLIAANENAIISKYSFGAYCCYLIQFYLPIFILFVVSHTFRLNFVEFYRLNACLRRERPSNNVKSLKIARIFTT